MLRIPHCLDIRLIDCGKVVGLTHPPHFTPQKHYYFTVSTWETADLPICQWCALALWTEPDNCYSLRSISNTPNSGSIAIRLRGWTIRDRFLAGFSLRHRYQRLWRLLSQPYNAYETEIFPRKKMGSWWGYTSLVPEADRPTARPFSLEQRLWMREATIPHSFMSSRRADSIPC
jgi:hypothetical protein